MTLGERLKEMEKLQVNLIDDIKKRAPYDVWRVLPDQMIMVGGTISLSESSDYGDRKEIIEALEWLLNDLKNTESKDNA